MKLMSKNVFWFPSPRLGVALHRCSSGRDSVECRGGSSPSPPRQGLRSKPLCRHLLPRRSPAEEKLFGWVYFLFVKKKNIK